MEKLPKKKKLRGMWRDRNGWQVAVRAARFFRRCKTQAEASAYYNAVASKTWDGLSPKQLNNPWQIRRNIGFLHSARQSIRVVEIDEEEYFLVDESDYMQLKDWDWFIDPKTHFPSVIMDCEKVDGKWTFKISSAHDIIFGGPARHINGNPFDNRSANLCNIDQNITYLKSPLVPLVERMEFSEEPDPVVADFIRRLVDALEWKESFRVKGFAEGVEPRDPRKGFPDWKEWLEEQGGSLPEKWAAEARKGA